MTHVPKIFGIIGWPVAHSKSPAMHNAAFEEAEFHGVYTRFAIAPSELEAAMEAIRILEISGLNVTLPHKEKVMPFLDEIHPDAQAIGAVNTIVRRAEKLVGYNTDAEGFVRSLREKSISILEKNVVILGTGGAARAAIVGLSNAGAKKITVVGRTTQKAENFVRSVGSLSCEIDFSDYGDCLEEKFRHADLLVQATSATLDSSDSVVAFVNQLPLHVLPKTSAAVDMVYNPLQTALLEAAEKESIQTVQGIGMLLHQGALAFELWTEKKAPLDVMRNALLTE